ncbi:MAG: glycosyltransferase family 4 protein [Nitrosomonadales bacterium]|nr:glycosyltransferase family 4 protein [Nitrosomonadales bacterium]
MGGINYLRNLFWAIHDADCQEIQPVVFCSRNFPQDILDEFPQVEIVKTGLFDRFSPLWWMRRIARLSGRDLALTRLLRKYKIVVVSHHVPNGIGSDIKQIGWIPDFQHVHLPAFFSAEELHARDQEFIRICDISDRIIVSSNSAKCDLAAFYPSKKDIADVLQFAVRPPATGLIASREELQEKFGITGEYLYLPNQFWVHKNHGVVIEALHRLKSLERKVICVFTGTTNDHRHPQYFDDLMQKVRSLGVDEQVKMLGVVPYSDVLSLMHHARTVINPSFFEGWSTTVEEAKAMGKRLILSDIPVHREQVTEGARFFDPNNHDELAAQIWLEIEGVAIQPSTDACFRQAHEALVAYGMKYQDLIKRMSER